MPAGGVTFEAMTKDASIEEDEPNILGTAAVVAGLVSPLLIFVVALSGLGSYALPNYSLSFAFRMGQMALLIAGGLMGLPGVCLLLLLMVLRVAGMDVRNPVR